MLIKEPEMLLTDAFCGHTMRQYATVAGQKLRFPLVDWKGLLAGANNASQIPAGLRFSALRGSLRGVHGRRQGGIGGEGQEGRERRGDVDSDAKLCPNRLNR